MNTGPPSVSKVMMRILLPPRAPLNQLNHVSRHRQNRGPPRRPTQSTVFRAPCDHCRRLPSTSTVNGVSCSRNPQQPTTPSSVNSVFAPSTQTPRRPVDGLGVSTVRPVRDAPLFLPSRFRSFSTCATGTLVQFRSRTTEQNRAVARITRPAACRLEGRWIRTISTVSPAAAAQPTACCGTRKPALTSASRRLR